LHCMVGASFESPPHPRAIHLCLFLPALLEFFQFADDLVKLRPLQWVRPCQPPNNLVHFAWYLFIVQIRTLTELHTRQPHIHIV